MVNLVLEQDSSHFVPNKVLRLVLVRTLHQKVVTQTTLQYGKHQVSACLHISVANSLAPHLHCIGKKTVFRGRLLVFAIAAVEKTLGPAVAVVPIETPKDREVRVFCGGVGGVSNKSVDPVCQRFLFHDQTQNRNRKANLCLHQAMSGRGNQ